MLTRRFRVPIAALLVVVGCGKGTEAVKPKGPDTTAPVITAGPTVRFLSQNSATITWFTDDPSKSIVHYSTNWTFGEAAGDSQLVTEHSVALTGLSAGTEYHYRVESCNAVNLTTTSVAETFSTLPPPPPPLSLIVYVSNATGSSQIYRINSDGTNLRPVTNNSYANEQPALSPDRSKIAYVTFVPSGLGDEAKNIAVMNADGTGSKVLTLTTFADQYPCWSPDGTKIAFTRAVAWEGVREIHVMNADGSDVRRITYSAGSEQPSWSPDGTKLAFIGKRDGYTELFVMDADGSGPTAITQDSLSVLSPRWSRDGTRIAYVRDYSTDQGFERDVAIIGADGSNPHRVTFNPSFATGVCWDPDGAHLVYGSWFPSDIHRIRADGSHDVNLTNSAAREYQPDCR